MLEKYVKILVVAGVLISLLIVIFVFRLSTNNGDGKSGASPTPIVEEIQMELADSPLNATYIMDGGPVSLTNGKHEEEVPGSSTKIVTTVWGEPVNMDIEGNKKEFSALLLTQDPGGSGTFYYVAAAVRKYSGFMGTNAILIGDRISPQTLEIHDDEIIVNYADRPEGAPMSAEPTIAVSRTFLLENNILVEKSVGSEIMNATWMWERFNAPQGSTNVPDPENYTMFLKPDGTMNVKADCNTGSGTYELKEGTISFGPMALTQALCGPDSLHDDFLKEALIKQNSW